MTKANCERLLAHYEAVGNKEAAADMRAHISKSNKFTDEDKARLLKQV